MSDNASDSDKLIIGLYGEMKLAMELHKKGWQVYRAYIDEKFDFVIMKSYCTKCKSFRKAFIRNEKYEGKTKKCVTNLCEKCHQDALEMQIRLLQVKTSEGIGERNAPARKFSFHAKLRYHLADQRIFYVWISAWDDNNITFYIFKPEDVNKFDDLSIASYQITDNQKTTFRISEAGKVLNQGKKYDYSAFDEFKNNFQILE